MDKEELKKKIVEILDNNIRWQPYYYISRGIVYEDDLKNIADALIAAGYGDVKEAEHRAARAERALDKVFTDTFPWCCAKIREDIVQECLQEAEKELAEERKDD